MFKGFTLIETVIYLALFTILIGGVAVGVYNVFESAGRNETKAMLQQEGDFMIAKINWTMSGVRSINQPSVNTTGQPTLSVDKWGSPYGNPVVIDTSGTTMRIKDGAHAVSVLNNTNITVVLLTFDHLYAGGTSPESVTAHLTLSTRTSAGLLIQETFSTTSYVRK